MGFVRDEMRADLNTGKFTFEFKYLLFVHFMCVFCVKLDLRVRYRSWNSLLKKINGSKHEFNYMINHN